MHGETFLKEIGEEGACAACFPFTFAAAAAAATQVVLCTTISRLAKRTINHKIF
jgi:hypothetical protein